MAMMEAPFVLLGGAGGNDPNHPVSLCVDDGDGALTQESNRKEPCFSIATAAGRLREDASLEDEGSFPKTQPMLALVGLILGRIPFEFHEA
jgi:hypothetical protein